MLTELARSKEGKGKRELLQTLNTREEVLGQCYVKIFRVYGWKYSRHKDVAGSVVLSDLLPAQMVYLLVCSCFWRFVFKSAEPFFPASGDCPVLIRHNHHQCFQRQKA